MPAGLTAFFAELIPELVRQTPLALLFILAIVGFMRGWWLTASSHKAIVAGYEQRVAEKDAALALAHEDVEHWRGVAETNQKLVERAVNHRS